MALTPRQHIQNFSDAASLEPHWGYADRVVPCTNDPGSCAYLDVVYSAHDRGMVYTGIFWLTVGGILLVWAVGRRLFPPRGSHDDLVAQLSRRPPQLAEATATATAPALESQPGPPHSGHDISRPARLVRALSASVRRRLLPTAPLRFLFGRTTRLQLVVLLALAGYLTLWSFLGITYARWITPVKNQPASVVNTRTSLGPWADRVGVLAYALTPLSVLLASRENLLSLLTGLPYTAFLFLHRWTGYLVLAQSALHTLGWVLVEAWLYRPQPAVWRAWVAQPYAVWGIAALAVLVLLWVGTWRVVVDRVTGYEAFRKAHYVLAMVYIGALIGHWQKLQCFLVPGLVLWGLDRGARLVRIGLLHYGYVRETGRWGFAAARAEATRVWRGADDSGGLHAGDVVRLDFDHAQAPWRVGQHFFLCFAEASVWQSHPFTPLSLPVPDAAGRVRHSYVFRAKRGETKKIAEVLANKLAASVAASNGPAAGVPLSPPTTPVVLQGPYGADILEGVSRDVNVLCVAGGTGITYVLPVLMHLARARPPSPDRRIELVWAVKRRQDLEWVEPEMEELRRLGAAAAAAAHGGLRIRTFVTAEPASPSMTAAASGKQVHVTDEKETEGKADSDAETDSVRGAPSTGSDSGSGDRDRRPDVAAVVDDFVGGVVRGPTRVFGSGPPGMIVDLRAAVARCNSGARVWKGEDRFDVRLVCDDRLEW